MHVEVVAVVEVAVARRGVRDELGGLVDGIVVPGARASRRCAQQQAQPLPHPPATGAPHRPAPAGSAARPTVAKTGTDAAPPRGRPGTSPGRRPRPWGGARRRRRDRSSSGIRRRARWTSSRQPTRTPVGLMARAARRRRSACRCRSWSRPAGTGRRSPRRGIRRGPVPSRRPTVMMEPSGQTCVTIPTWTEVSVLRGPGPVEDGVAHRRRGRGRQDGAVGCAPSSRCRPVKA